MARRRPRGRGGWLFGIVGLLLLLHGYIGWRIISAFWLGRAGAVLAWVFLALLFISLPVGLLGARAWQGRWARRLETVARFWMGAFGILLSAVVLTDVLRIPAAFGGPFWSARWSHFQPVVALGLGGVGVLYALWSARYGLVVSRVEVPLEGLPSQLDGLRIAQLSDVHVNEASGPSFLSNVVAKVNALRPDVVAITGDLIDGAVEKVGEKLEPLRALQAKLGVFYVSGNHECYWDLQGWEAKVASLGLTVLCNEHRLLERGGDRLALGGVPDFSAGAFVPEKASRPERAFEGVPEGTVRVLLAHQPRSAKAASEAGVALQLSGHTHAGQIFPFNFLVRLQQPAVRGLDRLFGLWVYTHRGTGFWGPPMRLFAAPEIAELTLRSAPRSA